jgi:hypothetical protein
MGSAELGQDAFPIHGIAAINIEAEIAIFN